MINFVKYHSLAAILLVSLFASCKDTDMEEDDPFDPIEVEAYIDEQYTTSGTRAARLAASSLAQFSVYSFYNGVVKAKNVLFTNKNSKWVSSKTISWSTGAMDFYGISPTFDIASTNSVQSMNQTPKYFDYEVPTDVAKQTDVMYASLLKLKKTDTKGKLKFAFKPAMHYIGFTGKNSIGTDYKVYVKSIILHNVVSNGKFVFSATTKNLGSWTVASGTEAKYVNDTLVFATPIELSSVNSSLTGSDYVVIIPQSCTKWNTTATNPIPISTANANHNYYIETVAQIIKDEGGNQTYLLGYPDAEVDADHPKYESVYFPAAAKSYKIGAGSTLPILFNGGYNKDGLPYLENNDRGEGVEVTVSEWMDFVITPEDWVPVYEELEF